MPFQTKAPLGTPPEVRSRPLHGVPVCGEFTSSGGDELSSQTIRGGAYFAARYGLGVIVSLGNMLVMTRWIGPHNYGLFVTAIGLAAFLSTLARAGLDTYLVRRETAPDKHIYDLASTMIFCISVAVSLAGAAMAPLLVRWYGSHEFVWPYLALLLTVPLTGLTGVPMAKLERELDFRRVAGIELGGQVVGLMLAITLAWFGGGVWAPVGGQIAWQIFVLAAAFCSAGLFPRPHLDRRQAWEMLRFGIGITASQRVWQLRTLVNPLLVGRFAGAEGVAFVALAIRIAEALGTFRLAAGRMAIAALARLQDSPEKFRAALERAIYLQVMALGPLLCVFALLGPLIVEHLIGVRWVPCLAIFPFVAAGVLVNSVYNLQASALFVTGQQWIVMRSYLAHVALLGTGTWLLLPRLGIAGYGWAELPACAAYFLIHAELAGRVEIRYRKLVPWLAVFLALLSIPLTRGSWIVAAMLICAGIGWLARAIRPRVCRKELPMKSLALTLSLALAFFLASCSPSLPTAETTERASTEILRVIAENRLIAMQMKCLEEPLSDAQKNYLLASRSEYVIQSYLSALGAGAECQKRALRVCERTDPGQCVAVPGELNGRRPN